MPSKRIHPPIAERREHLRSRRGQTVNDPYAWLRHFDDRAVKAYLKAENVYAEAVLSRSDPLREELYQEMVGRIIEDDRSAPVAWGAFRYYRRTVKGLQHALYCRQPRAGGAEEVLLDPNPLAEDEDYLDVGMTAIRPQHDLLAYAIDVRGDERYNLRFKSLTNGEELDDEISGVSPDGVWSRDGAYFFYVELDDAYRPYRLWRHRLGEPAGQDVLLKQESDPGFFMHVGKTKDQCWITIHLESQVTTEVWYLDADGEGEPTCIAPRCKNIEYDVWHRDGHWIMLTNREAKNFRVVRIPVGSTDPSEWRDEIAHREEVMIEDLDVFRRHIVSLERHRGLTEVWIRGLGAGRSLRVDFEDPAYDVALGWNPEPDNPSVRVHYSSLVTPPRSIDLALATAQQSIVKEVKVRGGFQRENYTTMHLEFRSHDSTPVPVSIAFRGEGEPKDRPLLLNGYGAYGISLDPRFASDRLSLMDRGFVIAFAHIRGGSECGRDWYEQGRLAHKMNSFLDFIACGEGLIEVGYTRSDRLYAYAGSAGGLLLGTVINMRAGLFHGIVSHVPFVDVLNTMLDESLPLTVIEYDEWGDPRDDEVFERIQSYSPYDQVREQVYPHIFATGGVADPRVGYWEPAKWVAKLRHLKCDDRLLILKTNLDAGHAGASGRYQAFREKAWDYAFILMLESLRQDEETEPDSP